MLYHTEEYIICTTTTKIMEGGYRAEPVRNAVVAFYHLRGTQHESDLNLGLGLHPNETCEAFGVKVNATQTSLL